jgi:hypothetical protein
MRSCCLAAALAALLFTASPACAGVVRGLSAPVALRPAARVVWIGVDHVHRFYVLTGDGQVSVLAADARVLAQWSAGGEVRAAALPDGGLLSVPIGGGAVTRWSWDGRAESQWPLTLGRVSSLAVDPAGSVLIDDQEADAHLHLRRFSLGGTFLGYAPGSAGESAVAAGGRTWIASGAVLRGYAPDGTPIALLGHECPIGGDGPPCVQGIFDPAAYPLSLAPLGDGGVLVGDPGLGAIHRFSADGARLFSCGHVLGDDPLVAIAADGGTVLIAGTTKIAISHLTAAKSPGCSPASVRIERAHRQGPSVAFTLSRRAQVRIRLQRVRAFDCASRGLVPSRPSAGCATLGRSRELRSRAGVRGLNRVRLGRLAAGTWRATITAGGDAIAHVTITR